MPVSKIQSKSHNPKISISVNRVHEIISKSTGEEALDFMRNIQEVTHD
jgi:hypothetical protein